MFHNRKQITLVFSVNEEWVPGAFYDPEDFAISASRAIKDILISYKPEIISTKVEDISTEV